MNQTTYASRLRYLDAKDIDNSIVNFNGLSVRGTRRIQARRCGWLRRGQ